MAINKNKVIAAAQKYVQKGQIDKAIREYQRVVEDDPTDVRIWLKIGDLQAKKEAYDEATATYLKVANYYSEQGFFLKAVAVFKQVLKLRPDFVEVQFKLAALYKQLGLVTDARRQLEVAYQILVQSDRREESIQVLVGMVEIDPENVAARIRLAEAYSKEERVDEAVAEFAQAAEILRASDRIDDFLRVAERLLWHRGDSIPLIKEVASLYLARNDPRRALQKLQICYKADEKDTETMALLVNAFLALEQREKAVTILKVLATVHEEKGELDLRDDVFRRILILAPEDQDARDALREATGVSAVAVAPEAYDPRPVSTLIASAPGARPVFAPARAPREAPPAAAFPAEERSEPEGIEIIEDIAELEVLDEPAATELAGQLATLYGESDVFEKFGLLDESLAQLERARQLDPDNTDTQLRLKELYVKLDRVGDAVAAILVVAGSLMDSEPQEAALLLKEALELDPDNRRVQEMLADLPGQRPRHRPSRSSINLASRWQLAESDAQIMDDIAAEAYAEEPVFATEEIDIDALERELEDAAHPASGHFRPILTEAGGGPGATPERNGHGLHAGDQGLEYLEEQVGVDGPEAEDDLFFDPLLMEGGRSAFPDEDLEVDLGGIAGELHGAPESDSQESDRDRSWDEDSGEVSLDLFLDQDSGPGEPGMETAVIPWDRIDQISDAPEEGDEDEPLDMDREESDPGFSSEDLFKDELRQLEETEQLVASITSEAHPEVRRPPIEAGEVPDRSDQEAMEEVFDQLHESEELLPFVEAEPPPVSPAPGALAFEPVSSLSGATGIGQEHEATDADAADAGESEIPETLAEDMAEASFFIDQGLLEDAIGMLRDLIEEHGEHPALMGKIAELSSMLQDEGDAGTGLDDFGVDLDDALGHLEEAEDLVSEGVPRSGRMNIARKEADAFHQFKEGVAKQVGEDDADTHFDLGIAYREMGMQRDAIGEFKMAARAHNEVQCHLMIALCHQDLGEPSEAITIYKNALYCDPISEDEQVDIYYQMGKTYEGLQDPKEALYYFEKVSRMAPSYRDTEERRSALKAGLEASMSTSQSAVDSAFDDLVGLSGPGQDGS